MTGGAATITVMGDATAANMRDKNGMYRGSWKMYVHTEKKCFETIGKRNTLT